MAQTNSDFSSNIADLAEKAMNEDIQTSVLPHILFDIPLIHIPPIDNITVHPNSSEEYWQLMRCAEFGGWEWSQGVSPINGGDFISFYCLGFYSNQKQIALHSIEYSKIFFRNISVQKFYELHDISLDAVDKIENYFNLEKNRH